MVDVSAMDEAAKARASGWRTVKRVTPYLWPKGKSWVKHRVIWALVALFVSKLVAVGTPFFYKAAVDALAGEAPDPAMMLAMGAVGLTIAYGIAAAQGDARVATAVHGGDHFIYPDCRPAFTEAFDTMQRAALDGYADVRLHTPFVHRTKADIVTEGARVGTPFAETWSCYKGGDIHCGRCGTCVERREAFDLAGVADPTAYADPDYWRAAVNARGAS